MATNNMHMKFTIKISKQTWVTLWKTCRLQTDGQCESSIPPNFVGLGYEDIWFYIYFIPWEWMYNSGTVYTFALLPASVNRQITHSACRTNRWPYISICHLLGRVNNNLHFEANILDWFFCLKMSAFSLKFNWKLFPMVQVATRTTKTPAFWEYPPPPHDYPHYWVILDPMSKKVITCDTPSDANDDLCQIWKECKQNCRGFFSRWKRKN